jgi:hypothetical protein
MALEFGAAAYQKPSSSAEHFITARQPGANTRNGRPGHLGVVQAEADRADPRSKHIWRRVESDRIDWRSFSQGRLND